MDREPQQLLARLRPAVTEVQEALDQLSGLRNKTASMDLHFSNPCSSFLSRSFKNFCGSKQRPCTKSVQKRFTDSLYY